MKKLLFIMSIVFLAACGAPSSQDVYSDAIEILDEDLQEQGYTGFNLPQYEMVEIEDNGDGRYKVSGMVENDGMGSQFYVKLYYHKDGVDYEWQVD